MLEELVHFARVLKEGYKGGVYLKWRKSAKQKWSYMDRNCKDIKEPVVMTFDAAIKAIDSHTTPSGTEYEIRDAMTDALVYDCAW